MEEDQPKPVIAIRGRPATGKTTTAKLLSERLGAAYIDGDKIMLMAEQIQNPKAQFIFFIRAILDECRKPSPKTSIIFDWISPQKEFLATFTSLMRTLGRKTIPVTLHAETGICCYRNQFREDPCNTREIFRMGLQYSKSDPGHHLDNSKLTPEESVEKIAQLLTPEL